MIVLGFSMKEEEMVEPTNVKVLVSILTPKCHEVIIVLKLLAISET